MSLPKESQSSVQSRLATLESVVVSYGEDMKSVKSDMASIRAMMSASKQTNWGLITSLVAAVGMVIVGVYTTLSSESEKWALKSQMQMMSYAQPIIMSAEQSKVDRSELHERTESNGSRLAALESKQAAAEAGLKERLREIETQALAAQNVINMNTDFQDVVNALIWDKLFQQNMPSRTFHPKFHRED